MAIFTTFGPERMFAVDHIVAQIKWLATLEAAVPGRHIGRVQLLVSHVIDHSPLYQHGCVIYKATSIPVGTFRGGGSPFSVHTTRDKPGAPGIKIIPNNYISLGIGPALLKMIGIGDGIIIMTFPTGVLGL